MSDWKLLYLDVRSYGEPIRLILHYSNIPFENVRFERNEFYVNQDFKKQTPYGKVPVLEIKGYHRPIAQSGAILRHLARRFDLNGKNEEDATYIDELYGFVCDCYLKMAPLWVVNAGKVEGDKEKLYEAYLPAAKLFLSTVNKVLSESKSGYLLSSGLSYIDFVVAEQVFSTEQSDAAILKDYPKLLELKKRVYSLPGVKEYVEKRPHSVV